MSYLDERVQSQLMDILPMVCLLSSGSFSSVHKTTDLLPGKALSKEVDPSVTNISQFEGDMGLTVLRYWAFFHAVFR